MTHLTFPSVTLLSRRLRLLSGIGAVVVLSACGTTLPQMSTQTSIESAPNYAGGAAGPAGTTGTTAADGLGTVTDASGGGAAAGATTPTGTTPAGTTPAAGTAPVTAGGAAAGGSAPAGPAARTATTPGGTTAKATTRATTGTAKTPTKAGAKPTAAAGGPAAGPAAATNNSASAIPATGPGWDAKNVYIGLTTQNDVSTAVAATGLKLDPGSPPDDGDAIAADINKRGGLFGRQVVILKNDNSTAAIEADPNTAVQTNCTYFTQDHPVIALINAVTLIDTNSLRSCLSSAHTPLISLSLQSLDDQDFSSNAPYLYSALTESYDRLVPLWVSHLTGEGYFGGWNSVTAAPGTGKPVVGVIYANNTTSSHVASILAATLMRAGYTTKTYSASTTTDLQSAVVNFQSNGVTHVIDLDATLATVAQDAANQQYYPRYALDSFQALDALVSGTAPAKTLQGSLGVGWFPALDVAQAQDPGNVGAGEAACLAALAAGNQTFSGKRFGEAVGLAICDGEELVAKGAVAGGGLDPAHVRSGIIALGSGFPVGASFASGLSSTNFALPGGARDLGYDTGCSCFTYRGNTYPL